jgi:hypothetical protein
MDSLCQPKREDKSLDSARAYSKQVLPVSKHTAILPQKVLPIPFNCAMTISFVFRRHNVEISDSSPSIHIYFCEISLSVNHGESRSSFLEHVMTTSSTVLSTSLRTIFISLDVT